MSTRVEVRDLTVRYGSAAALDGVDVTLEPGRIYGLLGRNGSGKTTLLSVIAAFRRATEGTVRLDGVDPYENAEAMAATCLIRESGDLLDAKVRDILAFAADSRAGWDADYAARLLDRFEVPVKRKPQALSRGKRSALGVTLGLASRCPLTLFDEAYLGMDAPSRYAFYDELLADYVEHPRTIVLSSHLIDEVDRLLENVIVLDRGRVVVDDEADAVRRRGTTLTGPAAAVEELAAGRTVLNRTQLGGTSQVALYGELDDAVVAQARAAGVELGPLPLQDLVVHLTQALPNAATTPVEGR